MSAMFSEVLTIVNGRNQRAVENPDGEYPIYGSGGIMGYADDFLCEAETVIIGRKGNINKPIYVETPFWNVDTAFGLCANREVLLPKYLYYFCESYDFEKLNTTVTIPSLTKENLLQVEMPLPSLDEQKIITDKISLSDRAIGICDSVLDKLDRLIKSKFVEMFGDPVYNPMKWPVSCLGSLSVQINSGNTPKGGSKVYVDKGITFFRSQNVWKDRLEMDDIAYIDEETHKKMKRSSLKHGDILMTKTGRFNTENSSLGRAALYVGEDYAANVNGHVYFIRLKEGVNNRFVLRILVSDEYRDYIRSVCVGGIDKRQLNKEHIEEFPIICPPTEMVNEYVEFVQRADEAKKAINQIRKEAEVLKKTMIQEYFG